MARTRPRSHTRRTQERLVRYAKTMGYHEAEHTRPALVMEHGATGERVRIPATTDKKEMTAKKWNEVFTRLVLLATRPLNG